MYGQMVWKIFGLRNVYLYLQIVVVYVSQDSFENTYILLVYLVHGISSILLVYVNGHLTIELTVLYSIWPITATCSYVR